MGNQEMMGLASEVKQLALSLGADMVGVATTQDLDGAPEGYRPRDLLTGAKAAVVAALHLPAGVLASNNMRVLVNCSNFVEHKLNGIAYQIACFLEERGYLAVPIHPDIPVDMRSKQAFMGDLSHKHAAVTAGLGEIGTSTLLLTQRFGPRVRLISVVTDAPLEADKMLDHRICLKCFTCVRECPVGAIREDGTLDKIKCVRQCMPYAVGGLIRFLREFVAIENRQEKFQMLKDPTLMEFHQFLRVGRGLFCSNCMKVCPVGRLS
jgi:epoxyqueuosine reductase QueG